ncbi:MAG: alanine--tRNA ligase [Bacteroidota bacterium]|nr:alanine--tRNA ligase [Bacteroidota bacterium]
MNSNQVRKAFTDFFESKKHTIVPSAPMVVKDDPTLMFNNAGMAQFKDIFLGNSPANNQRVADSQKCLRVSGKHNDLEEVGHDTYHHTMFEMLGNWSFGDYFKEEAVNWAWEFLVEVLKVDAGRLYATVFEGDKSDKVDADEETKIFWKQYLPQDHILYGNKKDNFWEMGSTGPCGPCSEIHIDLRTDEERKKTAGAELVNRDHPQVIEIWNLVFIQYNRSKSGKLETLPQKHVDTGMGFERLCRVVQGKNSNYDIDLFQIIIAALTDISGIEYGKNEEKDIAVRVIVDHLRTIAFSVTDGQMPSNTGAGYVIRRILRRAVRYGYTFLGMKDAFIYRLVPALIKSMSEAYPELRKYESMIEQVIKEEETTFLHTLEVGIGRLDDIMTKAKAQKQKTIDGSDVFVLYDSYGFPYDLTELILKENGLKPDKAGFDKGMQEQKNRSKKVAVKDIYDWTEILEDDVEEFVGLDRTETDVKITRYRKVVEKKKTFYHLVFNYTPFYAESGGQVGDTGVVTAGDEKIRILDTQKEHNLIIHITEQLPKNLNYTYKATVDSKKRLLTKANHSATHLMHFALRQVLGNHVEQKGSLVDENRLRFDYAHFKRMSEEEVLKVEQLVNRQIRKNIALDEKRNIPINEAKEMGAMALFGEKYGDVVRVIKFGESVELCGGTHVEATGEIGFFKITEETSVAAGIRRIEAVTSEKAEQFVQQEFDKLNDIRSLFKNSQHLKSKIEKAFDENKVLAKQVEEFEKAQAKQLKDSIKSELTAVNGVPTIIKKVKLQDAGQLKDMLFMLKGELDSGLFALAAEIKGKANLMIAVTKDLTESKGLDAGKIIRDAAKEIRGGGGGQAHFASAGGSNPDGIEAALEKIKSML